MCFTTLKLRIISEKLEMFTSKLETIQTNFKINTGNVHSTQMTTSMTLLSPPISYISPLPSYTPFGPSTHIFCTANLPKNWLYFTEVIYFKRKSKKLRFKQIHSLL